MKFHGLDLLMLSFFSSKIFFSGDEILLKSYLKIDMLVRKKLQNSDNQARHLRKKMKKIRMRP